MIDDTKPTSFFFFHFNRPATLKFGRPKMTVHWNKKCRIVDRIDCQVPCKTKINNKQPLVVMAGKANYITVETDANGLEVATIQTLGHYA